MSVMFDTNILIYHLNGVLSEEVGHMIGLRLVEKPLISIITRIEILGWPGQSPDALHKASILLDLFEEQPLSNAIAAECIRLRQHYRVKLPDAIIAATALHLHLPLMTRNTADFAPIEKLKIINPFTTG